MSRYIVLPVLTHQNIPTYVIVDSATGERVRSYDCELWAQHEADALNGSQSRPEGSGRRSGIIDWYLSMRNGKRARNGEKGNKT